MKHVLSYADAVSGWQKGIPHNNNVDLFFDPTTGKPLGYSWGDSNDVYLQSPDTTNEDLSKSLKWAIITKDRASKYGIIPKQPNTGLDKQGSMKDKAGDKNAFLPAAQLLAASMLPNTQGQMLITRDDKRPNLMTEWTVATDTKPGYTDGDEWKIISSGLDAMDKVKTNRLLMAVTRHGDNTMHYSTWTGKQVNERKPVDGVDISPLFYHAPVMRIRAERPNKKGKNYVQDSSSTYFSIWFDSVQDHAQDSRDCCCQ